MGLGCIFSFVYYESVSEIVNGINCHPIQPTGQKNQTDSIVVQLQFKSKTGHTEVVSEQMAFGGLASVGGSICVSGEFLAHRQQVCVSSRQRPVCSAMGWE